MYPVLYSYKRCPYAMRARLAIYFSGIAVEQREIVFWDKPSEMLQVSPKGTVPVLVLPNNHVIDESWDIMLWALQEDSQLLPAGKLPEAQVWEDKNQAFKPFLDAYKYPEQFVEMSQLEARQKGEVFLQELEAQLQQSKYLMGETLSCRS